MAQLGPFGSNPSLAVAVSGGADSMALALLAHDWARARGGTILGLTVDHDLRPDSRAEAALTVQRLAARSIPVRVLRLLHLPRGPALAERARIARYAALTEACGDAGILHLLIGHHAGDQAETLAMRLLRDTHTAGLSGMAALRESPTLRVLRPLLLARPQAIRDYLRHQGMSWVEDPSNLDLRALRPRLRARFRGDGEQIAVAAALAGRCRAMQDQTTAVSLAACAEVRPEGFVLLAAGRYPPETLQAVLRTVAGASYSRSAGRVAELAARLRPATLAGVRIIPAGRMGRGWLLAREEAAVQGPVPAGRETLWDHRFRLLAEAPVPRGTWIAKLGNAAARFRGASPLPSAVLRTLPALWHGDVPVSVPHLGFAATWAGCDVRVLFTPPNPLAGAAFVPASPGGTDGAASNDCNLCGVGEP